MILCTGFSKIWFWLSQFDFLTEVWHFWQYHYNQAWPPQLFPLAIHFVHCLISREPHHQLQNFVACRSISVWTGVDTKIPFFTLPKTHLLCPGLFFHLRLLKMPGLSKTPGGGKIPFNFIVRMLAGANGAGLFTSLIKSTDNGR